MRIAITGANGFVGSNLAAHFHQLGHAVLAIVRPGADTSLLDPALSILPVDYNSASDLDAALEGVEILIHNAGRTRTRTFEDMVAADVGLTRKVIEAANRSTSCRHFLYISSQAASHPTLEPREVTEEETSAPVDWYGRSKALAEKVIQTECARDWTVVRPASVYGPGERDFLRLFRSVKSGVSLQFSGERHFSLIHVSELCAFFELCLARKEARNEMFFASDGIVYDQAQLTASVEKELGKKAVIIKVPEPLARVTARAGDMVQKATRSTGFINTQKMNELLAPNWLCSIQKARSLLGWDPRPDLESRLRETFEWYRVKGWL